MPTDEVVPPVINGVLRGARSSSIALSPIEAGYFHNSIGDGLPVIRKLACAPLVTWDAYVWVSTVLRRDGQPRPCLSGDAYHRRDHRSDRLRGASASRRNAFRHRKNFSAHALPMWKPPEFRLLTLSGACLLPSRWKLPECVCFSAERAKSLLASRLRGKVIPAVSLHAPCGAR